MRMNLASLVKTMKMFHSNPKILFNKSAKGHITAVCTLFILTIFAMIHSHGLAQSKKFPYGLQEFKNIEQIEYCVPLPLQEFREKSGMERAHHSFVHKKEPHVRIDLRGYYCDDTKITLEKLFTQSYPAAEEESGKIITKKEILKDRNCFYALGYYNNFIYKYAFFEISWVHKEEVVVLEIHYPIKQKKLWMQRLQAIIQYAGCS